MPSSRGEVLRVSQCSGDAGTLRGGRVWLLSERRTVLTQSRERIRPGPRRESLLTSGNALRAASAPALRHALLRHRPPTRAREHGLSPCSPAPRARPSPPRRPSRAQATWGLRDGQPVLTFSRLVQDRDGYLSGSARSTACCGSTARLHGVRPLDPRGTDVEPVREPVGRPGGGVWWAEVGGSCNVAAGEVRVVREGGKPLLLPGITMLTDRPARRFRDLSGFMRVRGGEAKRDRGRRSSSPSVVPRRDRRGASGT